MPTPNGWGKRKTWDELLGEDLSPFVKGGPIKRSTTKRLGARGKRSNSSVRTKASLGSSASLFRSPSSVRSFRLPRRSCRRACLYLRFIRTKRIDRRPFQRLDREWAHNQPGEFETGAMSDDDRRQVYAAYMAMVSLIDEQVGRILEALEESGQAENTLVIFMSDHGEMLGDHESVSKGLIFTTVESAVPLVFRWPAAESNRGAGSPA